MIRVFRPSKQSMYNIYADFNIEENDDRYVINISVHNRDEKGEIDFKSDIDIVKEDYKGGVYSVRLFSWTNGADPSNLVITTSRNGKILSVGNEKDSSGQYTLLKFYITDDMKDIYIYTTKCDINEEYFGNIRLEHIDTGRKYVYNSTSLLASVCDELNEKLKKWLPKRVLQSTLSTNTSLSYMEGQIDVLYKIIGKLIEKTGIDVSEYQKVLDAVEQESSVNLKGVNSIADDMIKEKGFVRKEQRRYYNQLENISNNNINSENSNTGVGDNTETIENEK